MAPVVPRRKGWEKACPCLAIGIFRKKSKPPLHSRRPGVSCAANLKPTKEPTTQSNKDPPLTPANLRPHVSHHPTPLSPSIRESKPPNQGNPKNITFPRAPVLRPAKLRLHIRLSVPSVPLWQNQTQKPCKNAHFPSGTNRHQAPGVRPSPGAETCIDRNHHIPNSCFGTAAN